MAMDRDLPPIEKETSFPAGSSLSQARKHHSPSPEGQRKSCSTASPRANPPKQTDSLPPQVSAERKIHKTPPQSLATVSLNLDKVRTVDVRCEACHTVLHFPRMQWVNSPECCPNCGTRWMHQPAPNGLFPEDTSAYVFEAIVAFREALQAIATVQPTAVFTLTLEMEGSPIPGTPGSTAAGQEKNGNK